MESQRLPAGIGRGIYSYNDAALLLGASSTCVRRWADGYTYKRKYDIGFSAPILQAERKAGVISFQDFLELFYVRQYDLLGVKLPEIRAVAQELSKTLGPY